VSPGIKKDPYPYNPQLASKLLEAHGWVKGPGGVDVCNRPGTGSSECVCPSTPPCNWGLIGYSNYMWTYGQYQTIPNGTSQWGKGNFWGGGYYTPKAQKLIDAVETTPGLKPLYAAENYLSKDLASLWWPLQDLRVIAVKKALSGWQHLSPYGAFVPQTWYLTKS
jgi:peptide/nickel transport system substrate-binding protein